MTRTKVAPLAVILALTSAAPREVRADDASLQDLLNETIITTASKSTEKGSTAPAISTILTAEDIRHYGIHSIDEAVDFLSLGAVTSNPLRSVDIGARGVLIPSDQGNHILLLVDGHAVNEALYGAARFERGAGIPMELVDHIEVILGPGSVLYGSNAMLGVINVVTKRAKDFAGTHVAAESEIGKSWRAAAGAGYELGTSSELALELEYYRQSGPAFTVGPQRMGTDWVTGTPWRFSATGEPTGVWGGEASHSYYAEVPSGLVTFRMKNFEVTLHGAMYKRASPFNHVFLDSDSDFDDPANYEVDRSLWVDLKHRAQLSPMLQLSTRLYADTFDYQRYMDGSTPTNCLFVGVTTCRDRTIGVSRWVGLEAQTSWDWLRDDTLVTLLGVDGRLRHVGSVTDRLDFATERRLISSTGAIRENDAILGAYLQQTWQPTPWLGLNGGGRLDLDERFGQRVSPRAAVSVQAWHGGTLKGVFSEAFRAPSWYESAWTDQRQLLAENLRPETVRSVEGSVDQKLGPHRLLFGVFRSWWSDLVEQHVFSPSEVFEAQRLGLLRLGSRSGARFRNVASIDNYGFNAGYEGALGDGALHYGANFTGAIARRTGDNGASEPLTVAPQFFGNLRVSYDLPGDLPVIGVATHYLAKRPADRAFDAGFDPRPYAPPQLEIRATLSGPLPFLRGLSYRGSVNYALASQGPYVVGPLQGDQSPVVYGIARGQGAELNPVDVFRVSVGLQYDFGGSR
jgi:outer membrane receptor protein involved in Fe transport